MAASVDKLQPPSGCRVEETKTLIAALNLLSRNLPLPPDVLRAVSSIYHADSSVPPSREAQLEMESAPAPEDEVDNVDGGTPSSGEEVVWKSPLYRLILIENYGFASNELFFRFVCCSARTYFGKIIIFHRVTAFFSIHFLDLWYMKSHCPEAKT